MTHTKYLTPFILAAVLVSCGHKETKQKTSNAAESIPVKVIALQKTDVMPLIHTSGQFTTDDETILSFKTGGIISNILVKEGDKIKKGQLLATLDLTEIAASANQAQLGYDKTLRDLQRAENLYRDSVVTLEQLQNARTASELARQLVTASRFNLAYSEIRALSDGIVLKKFANPGQVTGSGMPVIQTNSAGKSDWILRVGVSDNEWSAITLKDKAIISFDIKGYNTCEGFVSAKSEGTDPYTGSFTIDIKLTGPSPDIAAGMFGKAEIHATTKQHHWQIPYESLLDGNGDNGFVFITNDDKTAKKVPVRIVAIEAGNAIISNGLEGAASLIVSGSAYLNDLSPITIIK